MLLHRLCDFRL